jgi:sugar lactone lactonase YvrE
MGELQVLTDGIAFGESPRWHEGRLWFADWMAQEIVAVDPAGTREVVARMPTFPFSIDWSPAPDGRLLVVAGGDRALLRQQPDGSFATVADLRGLCDQPWNELVVDGRGNAYLNSIGFDMMGGEEMRPGLIAVVTPDGRARTVADDVLFPNGMAVTPDDATLIVAESHGNRLTAFDIDADGGGGLSGRRVWADLDGGFPDGICLDAEGAVWYGDVPNQRCVRVAEGGEVLATVELDRGCFACALGGDDGTTLFMVATRWGGTGTGAIADDDGADTGPDTRTGQIVTTTAPVPGAYPP